VTIRFAGGAPQQPEDQLSGWFPQISLAASRVSGVEPANLGDEFELSEGYEVRNINPALVGSNSLADAVTVRHWRFVIFYAGQAVGEAEFTSDDNLVAFHEGEGGSGFLVALDRAEQLDGDFEASVLIAPALRFIGLWLRGAEQEWIIPYPPNVTGLRNYEAVTPETVLADLQAAAAAIPDLDEADGALGG
jgi:hypothetical protein